MNKNTFEAFLGLIVLIVASYFFMFVYRESKSLDSAGYALYANFNRVDGLNRGSDIKLSGIKIGKISHLEINPENYMAKVTLDICKNIKLPEDTVAEIVSEGFMGARYIALVPGGSDQKLNPGETIEFTQSAISFESLISRFIFNSNDKNKEADDDAESKTQEDLSDPLDPSQAPPPPEANEITEKSAVSVEQS